MEIFAHFSGPIRLPDAVFNLSHRFYPLRITWRFVRKPEKLLLRHAASSLSHHCLELR